MYGNNNYFHIIMKLVTLHGHGSKRAFVYVINYIYLYIGSSPIQSLLSRNTNIIMLALQNPFSITTPALLSFFGAECVLFQI